MNSKARSYDFLGGEAAIPRGNVTGRVVELLRHAIVTLEFQPGDVIDKARICEQLGISRFPVSEALARLQIEGLVEILPQRGSRVALLRIAEVREFMLIRRALEAEAVHILAASATSEVVVDLEEIIAEQETGLRANDYEKFHELDLKFHEVLFKAMQFERVRAIIENARANVDRARRLVNTPSRVRHTVAEHRAILAAIGDGDSDAAAAAMRAHLDAVMDDLVRFAEAKPDLFADGTDQLAGRA